MPTPVLPPLSRAPLSGSQTFFAIELEPEGPTISDGLRVPEVVMLEQRLLPGEVVYHRYRKVDEVARAIRDMVVRGAPAIGIAAAYGLALQAHVERGDATTFLLAMGIAGRALGALQSVGTGARITGPPLLGFLSERGGFELAFGTATAAALAAAVVGRRWRRIFSVPR